MLCLALPWTAPSTLQQLQQHHVAMFAERCDQWNVDFEAVSATAAGASGSSRTSAEPTKQMLAQQRVWRTSQLAALSAASLTGYISYTSVVFIYLFFLKGGKKVFSLWNDPKMLWFWDKQLCQRVSIKNLYATARLWSSRRERERFHLQRADANNQQTRELWMYLSYFTSLIATGTAHQIL